MNALAWSLVHFLWQGAAIAALAAMLMWIFRSPQTRYVIGVAALALMLASFGVTLDSLAGSHANGAEWSPQRLPADVSASTWISKDGSAPLSPAREDAFLWVARAWFVGVFAFALRIVLGLVVIERLRRRALVDLPAQMVARFRELQERIGVTRFVRYCECHAVRVPAVIGLFRPIVLIPVRALTGLSPEQLEAVVAHELGHVKRFDVAVNFIQAIAETLFFFHPAVWWLNKRIRADREDCCDDVAVSVSRGSVGYARALATMAGWRDAPDFAMAVTGGPVADRVARLLGLSRRDGGAGTARAMTASLVLAAVVVAAGASFGLAKAARADDAVKVDVATPDVSVQPHVAIAIETAPDIDAVANVDAAVNVAAVAALADAADATPALGATLPTPAAPAAPATAAAKAAPAAAKPPKVKVPNPPAPRVDPPAPPPPAPPIPKTSYIEDMKKAGIDVQDVDTLVALKVQGVTPDYISQMRATGLEPNTPEIIGMAVQGITPDYVKQVRAMGFTPDAGQVIAMKVQGITPEYVKGMRDLGLDGDTDMMIAMKVQDISPDYVKSMRSSGLDADANGMIAMKVQGITPEYRKQMEAAGFKMDVDKLIEAKVMDITPEFIAKAKAHGFKNLDIDKLVQLKNADIL